MRTNMLNEQRRILLLMSPATYRTKVFLQAAQRLNIELLICIDIQDTLNDYWNVPYSMDFTDHEASVQKIKELVHHHPIHAIVAVDDCGCELAARASAALGLRHNSPQAAEAARNKLLMRKLMAASNIPGPTFQSFLLTTDPTQAASQVTYPCVLKPLRLSGSRGVIRANNEKDFIDAFCRVRQFLRYEGFIEQDTAILIEDFIPGFEVAFEGILTQGQLKQLALFDKPDPLDGPYFAETLYVTPSHLSIHVQNAIAQCVSRTAVALGLQEGPVHAELRVNEQGPWILEIAARSIGGLCSTILEFSSGISLEELVLRHAMGQEITNIELENAATGVMMIPVLSAGLFQKVEGINQARMIPHVTGVEIVTKPNQMIEPLPEGINYLGFIFARGDTPKAVEAALREAYSLLEVEIVVPYRRRAGWLP